MSGNALSNEPALLVGSQPYGEADSIVRFLTPAHGSMSLFARGLRKPGSKLAGQLRPADELVISSAAGKGSLSILTAVSCQHRHATWQGDLYLLSLYWFMLECAWLASADEDANRDGYRLLVNLLRSEQATEARHSLACVYCLRFLSLHGMLPDLLHDEDSGERLSGDAYCRPSFEGLIDAARLEQPGATIPLWGLIRIEAERLRRWRGLLARPLLEFPAQQCDSQDVSLLAEFTHRQVAAMAGLPVRSADFLRQQWKLEIAGPG